MNPLTDLLGGGPAALDRALAHDLSGLSAQDLIDLNQLATQIRTKADALALRALAAAESCNAAREVGEPSLTAVVARQSGVSRRDAAQQVKLATQLEDAPATRAALGQPGMSSQKAHLITDALRQLPADLTAAQRDHIEAELVGAAPDMSVEQFRIKARRALETIDTDRANQIENARLDREEANQAKLVEFWMSRPDESTGMVSFGGKVDPLTADILRSAIEARTSPRSRKDSSRQDSAPRPDPRHVAGQAFADLISHLPVGHLGNHGGVAATLMVTISEDSLRGRTDEAGITEHGTRISAGHLRRLACNAGILPAVLGGDSLPLDLGREKRDFSPAQRRALAHRDRGCAHPDCDRPPGWTEAHHIDWWERDDGPSDLINGVLLCSHHHRLVHQADIAIRLAPDDGIPEFLIRGHWRRNTRYRACQPVLQR